MVDLGGRRRRFLVVDSSAMVYFGGTDVRNVRAADQWSAYGMSQKAASTSVVSMSKVILNTRCLLVQG